MKLVEQLAQWKGDYPLDSTSATLFNQFLFNLADAAFHPKLGDALFKTLLTTRVIDAALPRLAADPDSPWWDSLTRTRNAPTPSSSPGDNSLAHLKATFGEDPANGSGARPTP